MSRLREEPPVEVTLLPTREFFPEALDGGALESLR